MDQDLDRELSAYSDLWESGNYVLNHWRDETDDILLDCMIYDVKSMAIVRIEDNRISYSLKKRMREAGVPVVRDLPSGRHILEQAIDELAAIMEQGEFAKAYEELKE